MEFLRKVLVTLAPDFQEDNYFEAYIRYVKERRWAEAEGQDPEKVEYIPPSSEGDEDEGTTPLEGKAGTPDNEGPGTGGRARCVTSFSFLLVVPFGLLAFR